MLDKYNNPACINAFESSVLPDGEIYDPDTLNDPDTSNVAFGVTTPIPIRPPGAGVIDVSPAALLYEPVPNMIPPILIEFLRTKSKI